MWWLDLEIGGRIVGHVLSHFKLVTTHEVHVWGKKRLMEACASKDGSREIDVVHARGFHGGMVATLNVGSH